MVLTNTTDGAQTSKGVISQVLAEEHHWVHAAGGNAMAYYAKGATKGKKKGKQCSYCKNKGHITSECCKCKLEESTSSNTSTGKTLGKSQSEKSLSAKLSSRGTTFKLLYS
jgi:NAD(P)H-flavin reductase